MGLITARRIRQTAKQANSLEDRVKHLETELENTRALLKKTLVALETHSSKDIDGDGKLG